MSLAIASRPKADFVETPYIRELTERGLGYLAAGFGLNLEGHAGSGKTTLAFHIASRLGRPIVLLSGDETLTSSSLIGRSSGFRRRKVVDNFIHSVLKVEEESSEQWLDERLTVACRQGLTLIYDEFTRSRAEANNVLLPVLEEGILILPSRVGSQGYVKVHPNFRAIFTSNPEDYAGVHQAQEALHDRLVSIELGPMDFDTEVQVVSSKSALPLEQAKGIVKAVRAAHTAGIGRRHGSVRSSLQIAKVTAVRRLAPVANNPAFCQVVFDVLGNSLLHDHKSKRYRHALQELLHKYCRPSGDATEAYTSHYSNDADEESSHAHPQDKPAPDQTPTPLLRAFERSESVLGTLPTEP